MRRWSVEDREYLADWVGLKTHKMIAVRLGRTTWAVRLMACRLGYSYYHNFYSYTVLAKELGVSRATLRKWVQNGMLNGQKASWKSIYGKEPMIFTEDDIVKFLKNCNGQFANRVIPNLYFRNVYKQAHEESHA